MLGLVFQGRLLASVLRVDVDRVVGLRGARKQMYEGLAVPLARATIDKGRILNSSESRAVMAAIRRNF